MFDFNIIDVEDFAPHLWLITFADESTTFYPKDSFVLWTKEYYYGVYKND